MILDTMHSFARAVEPASRSARQYTATCALLPYRIAALAAPAGGAWRVAPTAKDHDMTGFSPRNLLRPALAAALIAVAAPVLAQPATKEPAGASLFKVITVKDEVTIGLNAAELGE